jgi:hypothetical protein
VTTTGRGCARITSRPSVTDWTRHSRSPTCCAACLLHVEAALTQRGFGEERLLAPLWRRLERRQNPAQRARAVFRHDGVAGLLNHATIRPGEVKR